MKIDEIETILSSVFNDKNITFAYLFGSYAKGEAVEHSDVDLMIFGPITGLDFFSLGGELERALHKKIDLIRFEDVSSNVKLVEEIMKTGIRIYEKR